MTKSIIRNLRTFKYLKLGLIAVFILSSCSETDNGPDEGSGSELTATLQFSDGKTVDFDFSHQKDDLIKSSWNGPNGNGHYKLWLRGEKTIGDAIYTLNVYVTTAEQAVGTYPFGTAWQWHDQGFVTEIHVGRTDRDDPLDLRQYASSLTTLDHSDSSGLKITSHTTDHAKGTFSGKAGFTETDFVTIVNGKFDIGIKRGTWED